MNSYRALTDARWRRRPRLLRGTHAPASLPYLTLQLPQLGTHRDRPIHQSHQAGVKVRDVTTPIPRVLLSIPLTGPAPSGSTGHVPALSGLLPPSPSPHGSDCPQLHHPCYDKDSGESLSPPLETQRLTAQTNNLTSSDDLETLLAFFGYPAEHWVHLRTTNPIESTFPTVRLRQRVTKGPGLRAAGVAMAFKLIASAQARWRAVPPPRPRRCPVREGQTHRTKRRPGPRNARTPPRLITRPPTGLDNFSPSDAGLPAIAKAASATTSASRRCTRFPLPLAT